MYTACPAAWTLLPFEKLLNRSRDPSGASFFLFGIFNPADKLVSGDRRQALPKTGSLLLFGQRIVQVGW
jgi:hypothetical protein